MKILIVMMLMMKTFMIEKKNTLFPESFSGVRNYINFSCWVELLVLYFRCIFIAIVFSSSNLLLSLPPCFFVTIIVKCHIVHLKNLEG